MKLLKNVVIALLLSIAHNSLGQGLLFDRMGYFKDKATSSFNVFDKHQPTCSNALKIKFELSIQDPATFGYVLRVRDLSKDGSNSDTFSIVFSKIIGKNSYCLKVSKESVCLLAADTVDNNKLGQNLWMSIELGFDIKRDVLDLTVDGRHYQITDLNLPKAISPQILFGTSLFSEELPLFAIRGLDVECDRKKFNFPLDECEGGDVHEKSGKIIGHAISPEWLIKNSFSWNKLWNAKSQSTAGISFDATRNRLIMVSSDSLSTFNVRNMGYNTSACKNKMTIDWLLGTTFIDPKTNRLHAYEICPKYAGATTMSTMDPDSSQWRTVSSQSIDHQIHHHATAYDTINGKYYIFGGFGSQSYYSTLIEFDVASGRFREIKLSGDHIAPRFFCSMSTWKPNKLLLFGGMGNSAGDQALGKVYYYDLYEIDLIKGTAHKLWDAERMHKQSKLSPVRNMIVSDDSTSLYTLCYPVHLADSYLRLYKISLRNGKMEPLGDTIPMQSRSILSNANIYYDKISKVFYCYTQEFDRNGGCSSNVNIYSLTTPIVKVDLLSKYSDSNTITRNIVIISIFCIIIICIGIIYIRRRRTLHQDPPPNEALPVNDVIAKLPTRNAILLLGAFTVIDRNGRDITYMFSAKLRQLFLYLLMNSIDGKDGVHSTVIQNTIWPDKPTKSAKNLKCVAINHLRKILSDLDGVSIIYNDNGYSIALAEETTCDYVTALQYIADVETNKQDTIAILNRGKLLQSLQDDIFDSYKSIFEDKSISYINASMKSEYERHNYSDVIAYARILFAIDKTNGYALWYIVNSLCALHKEEASKKVYYLFSEEYQRSMGSGFDFSYSQITKITPDRLIH